MAKIRVMMTEVGEAASLEEVARFISAHFREEREKFSVKPEDLTVLKKVDSPTKSIIYGVVVGSGVYVVVDKLRALELCQL